MKESFDDDEVRFVWVDGMTGMLGRDFPVLEILDDGEIIGLPAANEELARGGKWRFPESVLRLGVGTRHALHID